MIWVNAMDRPFVSSIDVFNHLAESPVPERAAFERAASQRRLAAGDILFRAGDSLPTVFVVNQGIIKLLGARRLTATRGSRRSLCRGSASPA
jgi:CRP-like cAMP-binding protein